MHQGRESAAQGAAVDAENALFDPDLHAIIERWSDLPNAVKAAVLTLVQPNCNEG